MIALLVMLAPINEADKVIERNATFMKSIKSLSVDMKVSLVTPPLKGTGRLVFELPRRTRFDLKMSPNIHYNMAASEEGILEIEHTTKQYMEDVPAEYIGVPESRISFGPQAGFPTILLRNTFRAFVPQGGVVSYGGKSDFNGKKVDKLLVKWESPTGSGQATCLMDAQGRIVKLAWSGFQEGRPVGNDTEFSNYVVNKAVPMSTFRLKVPAGYLPYSLPPAPLPPEVGTKIKLGKWKAAGAAELVDLDKELAGKPALLFVMDPNCVPSTKAREMVAGLAKDVRVVELLFDGTTTRVSRPKYFHGGPGLKTLMPASTPSFYLLGSDGSLQRMWYGFDAGRQKAMDADIRAAIKALG